MKATLISAFIIIAAVVALAFSCPDEQSFDRWIEKSSSHEDASLIAQAGDKVLSAQTQLTAEYDDHVLWATVDAHHGTSKVRYVGLVGIWFELSDS